MAIKKIQQPLLYIQQPVFESKYAQMQHFFINKKSKEIINPSSETNNEGITQVDELLINVDPDSSDKMESNFFENVETSVEEEEEPKIMEFLLEEIFTSREQDEVRLPSLIDIENQNFFKVKNEDKKCLMEEEHNKSRKKIYFNELNLVNKLNQIKRMPANVIELLYEFNTKDNTTKGYFLSHKEGEFSILLYDTNKIIKINEPSIKDINIIGF